MRDSGILLPIFALPSKYGIGSFSKEAYAFVDFLRDAGQKCWQVLPLGPTGYGDSPYQSFSTFAGNPYYIDLERLIEDGLLSKEECDGLDWGEDEKRVDYQKIYVSKNQALRKAFERFSTSDRDFLRFVKDEAYWLDDYALFTALKGHFGGVSWMEWEPKLKARSTFALGKYKRQLRSDILFVKFTQYQFMKQWQELKRYANRCRIKIIGDIPIYVSMDSADVWANRKLFQFDKGGEEPIAVAGCPADYFSETGQLWGNPLYSWKNHRKTKYRWWIQRMEHQFALYDVVRVDHFRGFDEYYAVPFGEKTALNGEWELGPGIELFDAIRKKLGKLDIIAEDLGYITEGVRELLKDTGYPGMKVLQFAFDPESESEYLPHTYKKNCVVYTGTHDNATSVDWFSTLSPREKEFAKRYTRIDENLKEPVSYAFIYMAMASVANRCIIPMQDYLGLGKEGRINTPSTLGENWQWRMQIKDMDNALAKKIRSIAETYFRAEKVTPLEEIMSGGGKPEVTEIELHNEEGQEVETVTIQEVQPQTDVLGAGEIPDISELIADIEEEKARELAKAEAESYEKEPVEDFEGKEVLEAQDLEKENEMKKA
ncbi:MAG TPA: 4-alpha-glucanotransferase [Lachnospiraceae bacterium]